VFCRLLEDLENSLREAVVIGQELDEMGVSIPPTFEGLALADSLLSALPEPEGELAAHLVAHCRDDRLRSTLLGLVEAAGRAQATYNILAAATSRGDPTRLLMEGIPELLMWAVTTLEAKGLDARDVDALRTALERGRATEGILGKSEEAFAAVAALLGINVPCDLETVSRLLNGVRAIERAPYDALHLRTSSLEIDGADRIIQQAAARAQDIERQQSELDRSLDISRLHFSDAERLRTFAVAIENAWAWQRSLGPQFAMARQMYHALARGDLKVAPQEMARQLRAAADHVDARAGFELDPWCHEHLGPHFAGTRTNWTEWQALANWYREVFELLPDDDACSVALRDLAFHSRSERLRAVIGALPANQTHLDTLSAFARTMRERASSAEPGVIPFTSVEDMARTQRDEDAYLEETLTCLLAADLRADLAVSSIAAVADTVESHRANLARLHAYAHVRGLIGVDPWDMKTDLKPVERAARFAETLCTWSLPRAAVEWLLCEDWEPRLGSLRACLERASRVSSELSVSRQAVRACAQSYARCESESASLGVVANRVALALEHREALTDWLDFRRSRAEIAVRGLEWASDLVQGGTLAADHLVTAFRFVFYNTLSLNALADVREPSDFSGVAQERARRQFIDADGEATALFREHVAETADDNAIPEGVCLGPAADWTGLALIEHELTKQRQHIPIRQLVQQSGTALQALKPCFMMDPASVAQYLAPGAVQFDLVVVDEASQLAPEEALGAIVRGNQLVVAGDPKQLPPADVFDRIELDRFEAGFEEPLVVGEGDSIFDMAASAYRPVRRLRTHYRSMHPDLIAFSNRELYGGDLIVCPSARLESTDLGVRYHAVPYGTCDDRRNSAEAEVVVGAIVEQLRMRPAESLGVIALTFAQQELIEELFEMRMASDPAVADAHDRMQTSAEPLLIRNLGRVQGEERDVIFISTTYGPGVNGNMPRRFGRISDPSGHRYVNVLCTRARKRTEVFCSLEPDLIPAEPGSPLGLLAFKQYLTAARDGMLGAEVDPEARRSTNFAQAVGAVLRQKGFDVVAHVGVAGMFVDLAVRSPGDPAAFLLGIECDGVRGPSSGSARDRHRLRQELLQSRGWTMHRVSSTDWFSRRDTE
ncbi:MAG: AAA domain-containing protein, partial [Vicinamibacterales bacterium]